MNKCISGGSSAANEPGGGGLQHAAPSSTVVVGKSGSHELEIYGRSPSWQWSHCEDPVNRVNLCLRYFPYSRISSIAVGLGAETKFRLMSTLPVSGS